MSAALLVSVLWGGFLLAVLLVLVLAELRSIRRDRRAGRPVLIDQRPPATIHSLETHRRRRVNARRVRAAQRERAW